ncbi:MAG TPA: SGNH/GDSL hydrolase family protein [Candidatus Saccharimonadales bacterium]|nr:SGNH/GDSL hydrolase family protein [Candidatus Saccharimonadales bacterium]
MDVLFRIFTFVTFLLTGLTSLKAQVISTMDEPRWSIPKEKASVELVPGKTGKAIRFFFAQESRSVFSTSNLRGNSEWDKSAGFSFWVKGFNASNSWGGLQFIYNDDYALRYDCMFPVRGTNWVKLNIAWEDLIPVLPNANAHLLNPAGENRPSKLSALWFGRWWYWGDYPAVEFAVDEIRLEPVITRDKNLHQPSAAPLARFLEKLKAGQPVTIVTMGDSLTDYRHWANRTFAWPRLLRDQLEKQFKSSIRLVNPAIGGTQLRQNLVLIPRWLEDAPEPDLVTICFGGNDWESGMRGPLFQEAMLDAVNRIRRATKGKADVLVLTTVPSVAQWETRAELAEACRKAAQVCNAGLADTEKSFHNAGQADKLLLFATDKVHLSPAGHALVAKTVADALGRP